MFGYTRADVKMGVLLTLISVAVWFPLFLLAIRVAKPPSLSGQPPKVDAPAVPSPSPVPAPIPPPSPSPRREPDQPFLFRCPYCGVTYWIDRNPITGKVIGKLPADSTRPRPLGDIKP